MRDGLKKFGAVLGFADRAGCDRDNFVDAVRIGEPAELGQHLKRRVLRLGRQRAAVEAAGAEPDHFLLAINDLKRQVGPHPHDDHVEGVGANVDGSYAHQPFLL